MQDDPAYRPLPDMLRQQVLQGRTPPPLDVADWPATFVFGLVSLHLCSVIELAGTRPGPYA